MAAGTDCRAPALRCAATSTWASLQVHGDVFRPPRHLEVLAALVGTGVQLALLVLSVILITIAGACPWRPGWRASRVGLALRWALLLTQAFNASCAAYVAVTFAAHHATELVPSLHLPHCRHAVC